PIPLRFIGGGVLLLCLLIFFGCDESPKVAPSTAPAPLGANKPATISYNTSMNFSSEGVLRAILHAGRVETYETKQYTWLDSGVRVDFYNHEGLHSSVLTSQSAEVNSTNNNMTAYGHVHIVSDSGTTVDTDSLQWDNKTQEVQSAAPVHIVEKNGRTTDGIGFESDQNLEHYHIMRPTIIAPTGSYEMQTPGSRTMPAPQLQTVPGAGAMREQPLGLPMDTTKALN
ncbi:MAG TPA: LPS export ABC transporter periplasmic protein LptC, partial [Candidatus Kapabacteria bacterium]|nr:LPS export ABC transporter periplasmic protein LptC [Candidatus Kapabacteria bacterium]